MAHRNWLASAVVAAVLPIAMVGCPTAADASAAPIMLGIHTAGESLPMAQAMTTWENKANAFVDTERGWSPNDAVYEAATFDKLKSIWAIGSIPLLSWYPTGAKPNDDVSIAAGTKDVYITKFLQKLKPLLAGPDGSFGNADDRRLLLRFAPEANGNWHTYSPIYSHDDPDPSKDVPPPPDDKTEKQNAAGFVAMWRHVHALFTVNGLDSTHVAWIFAVAERDSWWGSGPQIMEQLFPGDAFVDWVGVDGYNRGGLQDNDHWRSPADIMDPMLTRLRAVSTRPTAVSEYGSTALQDDKTTFSVAAKAQWLSDFSAWISTSGVRMAMYWNDDNDNPDYQIFAGPYGDDNALYNGGSVKVYDEYRDMVSGPAFVGADAANPRVVTDAVFLGT